MPRSPVGLAVAAVWFAAIILSAPAQRAKPQVPAPSPTNPVAQLGVELPTLGGRHWFQTTRHYFTPNIMVDIRDHLHATYVRTGWVPNQRSFEKIRWFREDRDMDTICASGLKIMILVPTPKDDAKGVDALLDDVRDFFARYTLREFGCLRYAEIVNEADLPRNGFADVKTYAAFYERVAPIVAAFDIPILTTGASGKDLPWTAELGGLLRSATPSPRVDGFGFHPYGVAPAAMADATMQMRQAAGGGFGLPPVYVTEIGQERAADLYEAIVTLAHATPTITIYEYIAQYHEDPRYALINNPPLYAAVQKAWATLHQASVTKPAPTLIRRPASS